MGNLIGGGSGASMQHEGMRVLQVRKSSAVAPRGTKRFWPSSWPATGEGPPATPIARLALIRTHHPSRGLAGRGQVLALKEHRRAARLKLHRIPPLGSII